MASNPVGEIKSECELKVRPAATTTQITELVTADTGPAAPADVAATTAVEQVPTGDKTTVSTQETRVGSQDNTSWQRTTTETVTVQKTNETTSQYELTSDQSHVQVSVMTYMYVHTCCHQSDQKAFSYD